MTTPSNLTKRKSSLYIFFFLQTFIIILIILLIKLTYKTHVIYFEAFCWYTKSDNVCFVFLRAKNLCSYRYHTTKTRSDTEVHSLFLYYMGKL